MSKIYRRESLLKSKPKKKKDEKARIRNVIVNFRMAPEEKRVLDNRIRLSGISKQDYMIQSSLYQQVITYGNVKVFDQMKKQLTLIEQHLEQKDGHIDLEIIEVLRMIAEIFAGLELQNHDVVNKSIREDGVYREENKD